MPRQAFFLPCSSSVTISMKSGTNSISPSERVKEASAPKRPAASHSPFLAVYTQSAESNRKKLSLIGAVKKNAPGCRHRMITVRIAAASS